MKRILATYDHPMLMDRIAGKNLLSLLGYEKGPAHIRSATHALSDPKYLITESGIIVLGKRRLIAPWNDIITFWYTIDCYFVGFDGQVALIRSADINTSRKPSMAGIIEVPLESLHYEYPGSDNAEREDDGFRPPEFIDGEQALKRFLEGNIIYREYALELGIAGNAKAAFTVDANGNLGDIRIIKSVDTILDKEIIVALQKTAAMWKAGNIDGVGIPVSVTLMVKFRIR